jgi:hypothetical protein
MIQSRLFQLLKANAFGIQERVGSNSSKKLSDYQVIPSLLEAYCRDETPNLKKWTAPAHGKSKRPLHGAAALTHQRRMEREAQEREKAVRAGAPTDSKTQAPSPPSQTQESQPSPVPEAKQQRRRALTESQVRQLRKRYVAASESEREEVIRQSAKRYHFTGKAIRDAATGRTYKFLPMPGAQTQPGTTTTQPKRPGRKSKAAQAVETAAAG